MSKPVINIAIVEDHPIFRNALAELLNTHDGPYKLQVSITAADAADMLAQMQASAQLPHICLLDLRLSGHMDGFDLLRHINKTWPGHKMKTLAVSSYDQRPMVERIINEGANGYLLKNQDPQKLFDAITSIYEHNYYYSDLAPRQLFNHILHGRIKVPNFTPREKEFIRYCCTELTYDRIAAKMGISINSVQDYKLSLCRKLDVHTRQQIVDSAYQYGLIFA